MKKYINIKFSYSLLTLFLVMMITPLFWSCDGDDDDTSGDVPSISYIRVTDPEKSDSLVNKAFLGGTIAIIGENLGDIREIWFNDQEAKINYAFLTSTSLIVTIPNDIPEVVTDSITLITASGTKVQHPFFVQVPPPLVRSMKNEYAAVGEETAIRGNYFIDDPNKPLQVIFPGNIQAEVTSVSLTEITVIIPEGAAVGQVAVKSLYGSGRSSFFYHDDRNIFLNFDDKAADGGWRSGVLASEGGINGNYVKFSGDIPGDLSDWNEDAFSFNYWPAATSRTDDDEQILWDGDLDEAVLKFEVNVTSEWSANALQMIFTAADVTGTNGYIADPNQPRGLWMPWKEEGSYTTDGWETVSFSLTTFNKTHDGATSATTSDKSFLSGLTFFVYHGGVEGTACSPTILIDNIRIVPQ